MPQQANLFLTYFKNNAVSSYLPPAPWLISTGSEVGVMSVYFGSLSDSQHSLTCLALSLPLTAAAPLFLLSSAAFPFSLLLPPLASLRYGACLQCILGGRYLLPRDR